MEQSTLILNRVLPILLLLARGYGLRRGRFLSDSTVDDLRKIVVNLAMPSVLLLSFLEIELQPAYLVLFGVIFLLCVGLLALGRFLRPRLAAQHPYFPFLMTGFEYGMLGVSLFGSAYGLESIGYIAVMDLGHELFIWFVLLAYLLMQRDGLGSPRQLVGAFLRSPVILAVLAGITLNLLGLRVRVFDLPLMGGLMATLQFLATMTIPLILLIIGYGIHIDRQGLRQALLVTGLRLGLLVPAALLLNAVLVRGLLGLSPAFEVALFTLLILPPPFIIPLYMRADQPDERRYVNNTLTIHTLATIALFVIYFVTHPTL